MYVMEEIGRRLGVARRVRGLTLKRLSAASDLSVQTLSNYEHGRRCAGFDDMSRVADVLGLSLDDLVAGLPDVRDELMRHAWSQSKQEAVA